MTSIDRILKKLVFELNTEALGRVRCDASAAIMPDNVREQIKAGDLDDPTFVRELLGRFGRRIEEGHEDSDNAEIGTPLSEADIQYLTDTEIESFSREIAARNMRIFESYQHAERSEKTDEKGERVSSVKPRKVKFPKNDGERDSDYLVRAVRRYMTEQDRRGKKLIRYLEKDDLRYLRSPFLKLHDEFERIGRSLNPSYADFYKQIERTLEPIRRQHKEIFRAVALSQLTSTRIVEVMKANQHWQQIIAQATASSRMFSDLTHIHPTWLRGLEQLQDHTAHLQVAAKLSLGGIAYRLTASEHLLAGVDFEAIRRSMALPELTILRLRDSINDMMATYAKLAESIRTYPDITHLPRFALPAATREVFLTGYAVDALGISDEADAEQDSAGIQSVAEIEEEISICIALLSDVDPDLAAPYAGARDALRGTSPDRARHFLSSQRELWNHLLRRIAPDKQVLEWIPKDDEELIDKEKPTRKPASFTSAGI